MKKFNNYFIDDFLFEKEINQWIRKSTIHTYKTCFNTLIDNKYINIDDSETFTELNFKRLLWDLFMSKKWSSHTYNRYKKNYKVFCDYLVRQGWLLENPLENLKDRKLDKALPKIFTQKQVNSILYTVKSLYNNSDFLSQRNLTIVYTYLLTWLRLYELVSLTFADVNLEEGYIRVRNWKGWKDRFVPVIHKLQRILESYLDYHREANFNEEVFFPSRYWNFMQHRDIYAIMKKVQNQLWFRVTCHMFRHTFATELVRKNLNIYSISQILWHSKLDTTKIYLNFDTEKVKETINGLNVFEY